METKREHTDLLPQAVERRAHEEPDRIAVRHVDGDEMSWGGLHHTALRWAHALERLGVNAGEPVVTLFGNGFESMYSWLGCSWLRAVEAPINTAYRGSWLIHAVTNAAPRVVLTEARYLAQLVDVADDLRGVERVVCFGTPPADVAAPFPVLEAADFLDGAEPRSREEPAPWDLAALIYTSGTTGASKAVMVPWGQFRSLAQAPIVPDRHYDGACVYSPYPTFHVTGKGSLVQAAVRSGSVVLREVYSTAHFWQDVRQFGCTLMTLLGPMARFLHGQPEATDDADNPLRAVLMTPVIPEVEEFERRFGIEVFTAFNMTEINCPIVGPERRITAATHRSCGRPRKGVEVRVVDAHDHPVPPDTVGELVLRSEPWELNLGYWSMPEKTVEAWRNGWFHTGDAFTYDEEGNFYFVDREKDYIRRRGENISSFEVEAVVNTHPQVVECGAVAVPSEHGEDEVKVAVVVRAAEAFDPAELIAYLIPRMPRFAIPRYVELWEALPKTEATQRIQKAKIRDAGIGERTWDREAAGIELPR